MRARSIVTGALLTSLALWLVTSGILASASAPSGGSVTLSLSSGGSLTLGLNVTDANGSALRSAMDGDFGPLVAGLPADNTTKASLLAQIAALEANPLFSGLFGNHDGVVSAAEVGKFETLLETLYARAPPGNSTGAVNLTLDGSPPTQRSLTGISFPGAEGPVSSPAPLFIVAGWTDNFTLSGSTHALAVSFPNATGLLPLLPPSSAPASVMFTAPPGNSITQVSGLASVQTSNDVWGWGAPSSQGEYAPGSTSPVSFHFSTAFPTGYVVVIGAPLAAAATLGWLYVRGRRRRARARREAEEQVGSSGSA